MRWICFVSCYCVVQAVPNRMPALHAWTLCLQEGTSAPSLVTLLQQLTEGVVGLIESLAVEKECIASEMMHVAQENALLQGQASGFSRVVWRGQAGARRLGHSFIFVVPVAY